MPRLPKHLSVLVYLEVSKTHPLRCRDDTNDARSWLPLRYSEPSYRRKRCPKSPLPTQLLRNLLVTGRKLIRMITCASPLSNTLKNGRWPPLGQYSAIPSSPLNRPFSIPSVTVTFVVPGGNKPRKAERARRRPLRAKWEFLMKPITAAGRR